MSAVVQDPSTARLSEKEEAEVDHHVPATHVVSSEYGLASVIAEHVQYVQLCLWRLRYKKLVVMTSLHTLRQTRINPAGDR